MNTTTTGRKKRPSKITIPEKARPLVKLAYSEMRRQNLTYAEMEWKSGVLLSTLKAWRTDNFPGLASIAAVLGSLGWELVPVPRLDSLSPEIREAIDEIGEHFRTDAEALGAAVMAVVEWPEYFRAKKQIGVRWPAPVVPHGSVSASVLGPQA